MSKNFGLFKIILETKFDERLQQLASYNTRAQSGKVYKTLNLKLKNLHQFNELNDFLQMLINEQIFPNVFVFNQLMLKLFKLKQVHFALKTFKLMATFQLQNEISYNTLISQLSHFGSNYTDLIFSLFSEAKDLQLTDTVTYNSMIHAMGKLNQCQHALDLFSEAKAQNKISLVTFSSMLYVLSKQKPVDIPLALQIFDEAKIYFKQKDSVLYANILLCIANSQSPNPVLCQEIYEEAAHSGLLNPYIISNTLFACSKSISPSISQALKIVKTAKKHHIMDAMAYANTLSIIAKSKKPIATLGLSLLNEAILNNQIDTVVYACALDVFVNADDAVFGDAEAIFQDAKNKNMYNHVTYASYLQFLAKLSPPPISKVLDTYHEAIQLQRLDGHIFSTSLYALAKAKNSPVDMAQNIFMHAIEQKALDSICIANLLMVYQNQSKNHSREAKIIFELTKDKQLINPVIISILLKILDHSDTFIQTIFNYCQAHSIMDEKLTYEFARIKSLTTNIIPKTSSFFHLLQSEANIVTEETLGMVLNGD